MESKKIWLVYSRFVMDDDDLEDWKYDYKKLIGVENDN